MCTRQVHTIMREDFEDFIKVRFGHEISVEAMEECGNGDNLNFFVSSALISENNRIQFYQWTNHGHFWPFGIRVILNMLANNSEIPPGYYSIIIDY